MMAWLIGLALSAGVPAKAAKPVVFALLAVVIGLALWGGKCAYDASVIRNHGLKQEAKQATRERGADRNLQNHKDMDTAAAAQRQKEIDDATRTIPDQRPSARQRAIACVELRRQAAERGQPAPAC